MRDKKDRPGIGARLRGAFCEDITTKTFRWLLFGMIALKLIAVGCQMIHIYPDNAPIDDELMFYAAKSIGEGSWLGAYNWLTLSKHLFFSVWLWLLHTLHIPYLIGGQLLWLAGCAAAVKALRPVAGKRISRLLIFLVLWWSPYSTAQFTTRVYRDNIFSSLCLIFFAGVIGWCLRRADRKKNGRIGWGVLAGVGLGLAWLTREDAAWLLPFGLCAAALDLLFAFVRKGKLKEKLKAFAAPLVAAVVCLACIGAYCGMNYQYYGEFVISDFSSEPFSSAMVAIKRADTDTPHVGILVCRETREKLCAVSPLFAQLEETMDTDAYYNSYGNMETREFGSGGYFWALRKAAYECGLAVTPSGARTFYTSLAAEINAACDSGAIECGASGGLSFGATIPTYDVSFLAPTLRELGSSLRTLLFFEQTTSLAELSYATPEQAQVWSDYTYTLTSHTAKSGTAEVYYYPHQLAAEAGFTLVRWIFRILIWPALFFGFRELVRGGKKLFRTLREKRPLAADALLPVLLLGLLLSVLLRAAMISYIEYTSFRIGTYLLYLAPAGAVLLLFAAVGVGRWAEECGSRGGGEARRPSRK